MIKKRQKIIKGTLKTKIYGLIKTVHGKTRIDESYGKIMYRLS